MKVVVGDVEEVAKGGLSYLAILRLRPVGGGESDETSRAAAEGRRRTIVCSIIIQRA
jgi:hypothetical protein